MSLNRKICFNQKKDASFPNIQSVFSSFFKGDLKEKQNKK